MFNYLSVMAYLHSDLGSDSDLDSNHIPVVGRYDWNLNPTLCSVIGFA